MAMFKAPKESLSLDSIPPESMTPPDSPSSKVRISLGERVTQYFSQVRQRLKKILPPCSKKDSVADDPNTTTSETSETSDIVIDSKSHKGNIVPASCECRNCRFNKPHKNVKFAPKLEVILNDDNEYITTCSL